MDVSSWVSGTGTPPVSATRWIGLWEVGAKIITPREFQLPPLPNEASHKVIGAVLPSALTFLSFPLEKNAIHCPSGDQKGEVASSVPAIGSGINSPNGRTQTCRIPAELTATKAILV